MVILPVLTGCLPNMVHCNGCWCDARMMLPLSDAAWDEETPTMILTLRWEPGVVPVRVSGPSGNGPLCVSVPVSEPLAQRKRKYCFWPGPGGCRSGRAATFKVKLILNFKDQWKENGVSWKAMEIGFKNSQLPSTTTARFPGYIGVHPYNHRHCHGAGRCRHQAFYSHSSSCRMSWIYCQGQITRRARDCGIINTLWRAHSWGSWRDSPLVINNWCYLAPGPCLSHHPATKTGFRFG